MAWTAVERVFVVFSTTLPSALAGKNFVFLWSKKYFFLNLRNDDGVIFETCGQWLAPLLGYHKK
jgi:hypothetical protein